MNRFIIDYDVKSIAESLCDQHIVKMPLEEAQMLCTALWHHAPDYAEENNLYNQFIRSTLVHYGQYTVEITMSLLGIYTLPCVKSID